MAETKVVNLEVKDNIDKTDAKVKELNKDLKGSEKAVKDTTKASEELGKTTDSVTGGMIGKFKGLLSSVKTVISSMGALKLAIIGTGLGALLIAIVSIKQAFTSSEEGQNKYAKLMGVLGSIMGNLIDVLSEIGDLLIWVFTHPQEALKKFVKLVKENIINRFVGLLELIPNLGKAITELFSGDFKGAAKTATDAVGKVALGMESVTDSINKATDATKEFIEEQLREAKIAGEIADSRAKANKLERKLIVERAEANRKIVELRDKAVQKDLFSLDERLQALKDAVKIETDITNKEIEAAKLRYNAKVAENALSKSTKEDLEEEANLKAKIINLETSKAQTIKRINTELVSARNEQRAADIAVFNENKRLINEQAKAQEKQFELLQQLRNTDQEQEIFKLTKQFDKKFEMAIGNFELEKELEIAQKEEIAAINQKYIDAELKAEEEARLKEKEANDKRLAEEKTVLDSKYKMTNNTINALIGLNDLFSAKNEKDARRQFKINKALSLAQASIQTFQAVTGALTAGGNPIKLATGAQFVEAGIAAAIGGANIAKIAGTQFSSGGSEPSDTSRPNEPNFSTPQSVQPSFNIVGDSGVNQLEALKSQPSKAYVVSGEVTTQQALDRNRQRNATL